MLLFMMRRRERNLVVRGWLIGKGEREGGGKKGKGNGEKGGKEIEGKRRKGIEGNGDWVGVSERAKRAFGKKEEGLKGLRDTLGQVRGRN